MNINALLSPSDSTASSADAAPPPPPPPHSAEGAPRAADGGKYQAAGYPRSPDDFAASSQLRPTHYSPQSTRKASAAHSVVVATTAPDVCPLQQSPSSHPASVALRHGQVMPAFRRPEALHRPLSTPQMETLADLASMQQRQQTNRTYSADSVPSVRSQLPRKSALFAVAAPHATPMSRLGSRQQSVTDFTMAEAPSQTPEPRSFESGVLSDTDSKAVTDLLNYLSKKSYDYESHVRLNKLLHDGFLTHLDATHTPSTYPLLTEMRQAREAMDTRFAAGEDILLEWLSDELLLASDSAARIQLMEHFQKAVQEEPTSVKLWKMYIDWLWTCHAACYDLESTDQIKWSDEDKAICRELFTNDTITKELEEAAIATQWRIDESHLIFATYSDFLLKDLQTSPSRNAIENVGDTFSQRLQIPHDAWDETKESFWRFVSAYEADNWEGIMVQMNELAAVARKQMKVREDHESDLRNAIESGDKQAEYAEFTRYLQWEKNQKTKDQTAYSKQLRCSLYERALLRFPTATDWWLDYIDFVTSSDASKSVLPLIERATRHCPWSGDLWGRRILRSDVEGKAREEIEATKHRATNSGLLHLGGLEELLKVLQQWCTYLRRHAFRQAGAEDDVDVAELSISAALDDIHQHGRKIYGSEFKGDPLFRLEKVQIKFFSEARRLQDAREIFRRLVPTQKDSHDFWAYYYNWELWFWGYERLAEPHRVETAANGPHLATAVVQEALSQRNLDAPEKVLDMYLNHFQQHESGEKLQAALVDAREFSNALAIRREKEAAQAAQVTVQQQAATESLNETSAPSGEKRKHDNESYINGHDEKRIKKADAAESVVDVAESSSATAQPKRDREHNSVTVKDLPADVTELDVKKFFREIGLPLSITIFKSQLDDLATATVEFESYEDVLAAKTFNSKLLLGHEVRIQSGIQNTLYVANYPPDYDEVSMRKLFDSYGEIIGVRFPSLKFDSRRRFCYVQFLTAEMARDASAAMDDKVLDKDHRLLAKISDPDAKKQRSGPQAEGRELFVKNIERSTSNEEIEEFFGQYGKVVNVKPIELVKGKRTGTVFVVFGTKEEATAALDADKKPFRDRIIYVQISTPKGRAPPMDRARMENINIKQVSTSASPDANMVNSRRGSDASMSSYAHDAAANDSYKTARERKIAILNLPDTVNDARVRSAMEHYGPLVKIQMRREEQGTIIEFANVRDAFNVRHGVDVSALGPNVRTGDVAELLASSKKRQAAAAATSEQKIYSGSSSRPAPSMAPPAISRPGQRGSRRGGLGFRRGGGRGTETSAPTNNGTTATAAKSNADFRAMLTAKAGAAPTTSSAAISQERNGDDDE